MRWIKMMMLYLIRPPSSFTLNVYEGPSGSMTLPYEVVFGTETPLPMVGYNIYMECLFYGDPNLCLHIIQ